jgi:predicted dehydrogenase
MPFKERNMSQPVRIGFVGVGSMGQCAHLKNYVTLPDCQVVAIAELRPQLGQKVAQRYGVPHVYLSAEEMLAKESLDGLVVSQPFTRHGQVVIPLYRAGIPIFTEKPLAGSLAVGEQMMHALKGSGTWHMVGYNKRSDPAVMWAKAEIERLKQTGEIGKLRYVRITMPPGDWVAGGFTDLITTDEPYPSLPHDPPSTDLSAEGARTYVEFVNYYIHQVNLLRYLLGEPYRLVYAHPSRTLLVAESDSGVAATIEMQPYTTTRAWEETALVAFDHGYVHIALPAPLASYRPGNVEVYYDPGGQTEPRRVRPTLPWVHSMRQQAINFVRALKGEIRPPCEAAEALEDLKIARDYLRLIGCN